ncbi:hypothetical protein SCHPADRAFT_888615 [Schizopora paradoxa]|uniref:C2H2-type domain-containing protein n=1 Tax=Schizopora paradoxa TaxID=27342 RepID=A0A0H2S0E1_9AGAM|nr:hypothetical protein SCHPADRAFT_888615 [Schizopora paradoxa]
MFQDFSISSQPSNRDITLDMLSCAQLVYNAGKAAQEQRRPSVQLLESQATRDSDSFSVASSQAFDVGVDTASTVHTSVNGHGENLEAVDVELANFVKNVNLEKDLPEIYKDEEPRQSMQSDRSSILPYDSALAMGVRIRRYSDTGSLHYAEEQAAIAFDNRINPNEPIACSRNGCDREFHHRRAFASHLHIHVIQESMVRCTFCDEELDSSAKVENHVCAIKRNAPNAQNLAKKILNVVALPVKLGIENTVPVAVRSLKRAKTSKA